ncbi:beta-ketoacyl synthase [Streptomyces sp. PU-14G]|uniref:beta-ketoacyl-[acyl-carrier-protein] synthase family protein n=1 Tax=Streptomyces sp. PU-14G TaxID=2800808 RepID=UPI0034DDFAAC
MSMEAVVDRSPAEQRRVVVTGLGVLSSIGVGATDFADALREGRSGVRPITVFDTDGFDYHNGCEVVGFDPAKWICNLDIDSLGKATQFSAAAARMAVEDSGLPDDRLHGEPVLISIGTTDGEAYDLDRLVETEQHGGPDAYDPAAVRRVSPVRLATAVAQELGICQAEAFTMATACSAGNYAIGTALDAIRAGEVDLALCGGADAMCRKTFAGFYRLGTIAPDRCRPFDVDREGILTGEGAGVLVLEELSSALSRGARIYAEVLGCGLSCDAFHPVAPNQSGVARCIDLALRDAGVTPDQVDLISAHGTGTKPNDVTEARAIREIYGEHPPRTVSMKSMLGHSMGAASALAAIGCALAITQGFIPPTINHERTDPECAVDCVPNTSVETDLQIVQNNGMAFGGTNAVVVLGSYQ